MQLNGLRNGDVIFFSLNDKELKVGMYLKDCIVAQFASTIAMMGDVALTCMTEATIQKAECHFVFRVADSAMAEQAADRMSAWLVKRLPRDVRREDAKNNYTLSTARSLFATEGFYNVAKFTLREVSGQPLTMQKLDQRARGLRMTHLILLAFQMACISPDVKPVSIAWFSFKAQGRNPECFSSYLPENLIEKLPSALSLSGKYLPVNALLEHVKAYPLFWEAMDSSCSLSPVLS